MAVALLVSYILVVGNTNICIVKYGPQRCSTFSVQKLLVIDPRILPNWPLALLHFLRSIDPQIVPVSTTKVILEPLWSKLS